MGFFSTLKDTKNGIKYATSELQKTAKVNVFLYFLLSIVATTSDLVSPWAIAEAIHIFTDPESDTSDGVPYLATFAACLVLSQLAKPLIDNVSNRMNSKVARQVNSQTMETYLHQPYMEYLASPSSSKMAKITETYNGLDFPSTILRSFYLPFEIIAGRILIGFFDPLTSAILAFSDLLLVIIAFVQIKAVKNSSQESLNCAFKLYGNLGERLENYREMHLNGRVAHEAEASTDDLTEYKSKLLSSLNVPLHGRLASSISLSIALIATFAYQVYQLNNQKIATKDFVMILVYLLNIIGPLTQMSSTYTSLFRNAHTLSELSNFNKTRHEINIGPYQHRISTANPLKISFVNVCLTIDGVNIIKNFNLEIQPGKMIAIVGRTGAGKTTILNLLLGFYKPTSGNIYINGTDIEDISPEELRSLFGVVSQHPRLIDGTIEENIAYARPNASFSEIQQVARAAELTEFNVSTIEDLETSSAQRDLKTSGGMTASGGQRQRIAIARALLKEAPAYILDEATSALDVQVSSQIRKTFEIAFAGITTIIITHDLLSVVHADNIIVLANGEIKQSGTFNALASENGLFKNMLLLLCDEKGLDLSHILQLATDQSPRQSRERFRLDHTPRAASNSSANTRTSPTRRSRFNLSSFSSGSSGASASRNPNEASPLLSVNYDG